MRRCLLTESLRKGGRHFTSRDPLQLLDLPWRRSSVCAQRLYRVTMRLHRVSHGFRTMNTTCATLTCPNQGTASAQQVSWAPLCRCGLDSHTGRDRGAVYLRTRSENNLFYVCPYTTVPITKTNKHTKWWGGTFITITHQSLSSGGTKKGLFDSHFPRTT